MHVAGPGASRWVGPRWLRPILGGPLVLLGATLVFRPFASLAVLILLIVVSLVLAGVGELLRSDPDEGVSGWVQGIAYLLAAVLVLVWPGATIRVLSLTVALALLVGGVADLAAARRVRGTARSTPSSAV